ncbi:hypothetical protein [Ornithinibacillus bavariensis]|uniref:Uncharacterized protein n=1 Tax=Ornithinibacillus bavariensis TaxID=545502 RepID=A0A919X4S6_9BACI|nr:hypothetical protein [Ornithinibacillus bavariensis]GIO25881.1 hypothetical protein J43TS3_04920 [Ornithinibacillus bavariensis]
MREKHFWIGIGLVILVILGNYIYFSSKQLDGPVFLEHYIAKEINEKEDYLVQFQLYYLSNKQNPVDISYMRVGEVQGFVHWDEMGFWQDDQPIVKFIQEFNHHYLVPVTVDIPFDMIPFREDGTWSFNTMEVIFTNGDLMEVPIGEVIIQKINMENTSLEWISSSGDSSGWNQTTLTANKDLEIIYVTNPFNKDFFDQMAIQIRSSNNLPENNKVKAPKWLEKGNYEAWEKQNGVLISSNLAPFSLSKGDYLLIYTQLRPYQFYYFDFPVNFMTVTENGKKTVGSTYINSIPELRQEDINTIIEERGNIK